MKNLAIEQQENNIERLNRAIEEEQDNLDDDLSFIRGMGF